MFGTTNMMYGAWIERRRGAPGNDEVAEERNLALAMARGDTGAFDTFYERYVDRLYRMIYYQLSAHQADAEDVLQETMIAAIRAIHAYRGDARLFTWLCGIAHHKITDHRRRGGPQGERNPVPLPEDGNLPADGQAAFIQATETRVVVRQALAALPDRERDVLLMKYANGLTVEEIARATKSSPKAVESLLGRARVRLREVMNREASHAG